MFIVQREEGERGRNDFNSIHCFFFFHSFNFVFVHTICKIIRIEIVTKFYVTNVIRVK